MLPLISRILINFDHGSLQTPEFEIAFLTCAVHFTRINHSNLQKMRPAGLLLVQSWTHARAQKSSCQNRSTPETTQAQRNELHGCPMPFEPTLSETQSLTVSSHISFGHDLLLAPSYHTNTEHPGESRCLTVSASSDALAPSHVDLHTNCTPRRLEFSLSVGRSAPFTAMGQTRSEVQTAWTGVPCTNVRTPNQHRTMSIGWSH